MSVYETVKQCKNKVNIRNKEKPRELGELWCCHSGDSYPEVKQTEIGNTYEMVIKFILTC